MIEIEAESASEAISKVNNMYWNEEIVLDYDDFVTSEIEELKYEQFTF